jgi:hypothetical protein
LYSSAANCAGEKGILYRYGVNNAPIANRREREHQPDIRVIFVVGGFLTEVIPMYTGNISKINKIDEKYFNFGFNCNNGFSFLFFA